MKAVAPEVTLATANETPSRLADYVQLTKPRIAVMVLFTVTAGFFFGSIGEVKADQLFHTLLGTSLVAASANALNQWLERQRDAKMRRTANRPLPAGRLLPLEVFLFGLLTGIIGLTYLFLLVTNKSAALVAAITLISYVAVYTPLKPITAWNTIIGAVPGALPPIIGWCAARGEITPDAMALFLILFIWQLPHFFAIAWMYRSDYAAGGMRMISTIDPDGQWTAKSMFWSCAMLLPIGILPFTLGSTGYLYLIGSIALGIWFLQSTVLFGKLRTEKQARTVLRTSLVYLPGLLALLILDETLRRFVL